MNKNRKILSVIIILVILLSHSIIPASAASDYYESTFNYYNYDCRSQLYIRDLYTMITYAGTTRLNVEVSFQYYVSYDNTYRYDTILSNPSTSSSGFGVSFSPYLEFIDAYYIYNIGFNTVYTVGLIY
jgi:hypothetical protein